jgi:hypothetical protein
MNGPGAILGFAMLHKHWLDMGMARKNGNQLSAAVTGKTDDADGGHD